MQIEDLAPRMSPAGNFDDASRVVEIVITWIGVGLQMTAKVFQSIWDVQRAGRW
jgi:hypothetical protein